MNRGAAIFNKLVPEGKQSEAARELDMDQSYLNRIARAEREPGLDVRKKMRDRYGIPLDAWDEPVDPTEKAS